jgi:hypothetical protein
MKPQTDRRDFLKQVGVASAGAWLATGTGTSAVGAPRIGSNKKRSLLFLTKSSGYQHGVVKRDGDKLSHAERVLTELGQQNNFEVNCTKDARIFSSGDIDRYDTFVFYTTGDLTTKGGQDNSPAMTPEGERNLYDLVRGGKGFVGSHCASDTFHTPGEALENQKTPSTFVAMLGGEFFSHHAEQVARMTVADPGFPGVEKLGDGFDLHEEWYSLKNFAPDMHVILRQETYGMEGPNYMRPAFPATWARMHGKGRVFYTSMGHREDVWTNDVFHAVLLGGIAWANRNVDADLTPNMNKVTPYATEMPRPRPKK